jgi:hypothetical protein
MGFAGKLARGLLQGMAGYYGEVADQQEYDRRAAILQQRDEALERLRQGGREEMLKSLQDGEPAARASASHSPRPGALRAGGREFWNGRTWVQLTAATQPEQQRLERNGQ